MEKITCTCCGGTNVWYPETKIEDIEKDHKTWFVGCCRYCRDQIILRNTGQILKNIDKQYQEYYKKFGSYPQYIECLVNTRPRLQNFEHIVYTLEPSENENENPEISFDGIEEFKQHVSKVTSPFTVIECVRMFSLDPENQTVQSVWQALEALYANCIKVYEVWLSCDSVREDNELTANLLIDRLNKFYPESIKSDFGELLTEIKNWKNALQEK